MPDSLTYEGATTRAQEQGYDVREHAPHILGITQYKDPYRIHLFWYGEDMFWVDLKRKEVTRIESRSHLLGLLKGHKGLA